MNLYYNPEKFGLALVKDVDVAGAHEFDIVAVFRRGTEFLVGHDSGCSRPTPFEGTEVDDLTAVTTLADVDAFARAAWTDGHSLSTDESSKCDKAVASLVDGLDLGRAVMTAPKQISDATLVELGRYSAPDAVPSAEQKLAELAERLRAAHEAVNTINREPIPAGAALVDRWRRYAAANRVVSAVYRYTLPHYDPRSVVFDALLEVLVKYDRDAEEAEAQAALIERRLASESDGAR